MAELLKHTNAHELLPPDMAESNTALPGAAVIEMPPKCSTTDPLESNFAEIEMLESASRDLKPRWVWWMAWLVFPVCAIGCLALFILITWDGFGAESDALYTKLALVLCVVVELVHVAAWTRALLSRKPR